MASSAYPVATTEQSLLGEGVFSAAFDEMNFYSVVERSKQMPEGGVYDQAQMLYNRLSRRLKSRMNQRGRMPGHLFMISSSRYPNDFTERKAKEALDGDKSIFVRDYAVLGNQASRDLHERDVQGGSWRPVATFASADRRRRQRERRTSH